MEYVIAIAKELNLLPETIRKIRYAAILHDIGKIGIHDAIISKATELTEDEFKEIKQHTEIGYTILEESSYFDEIRELIKYHHEKMDGSGYYSKKEGEYPWEVMIISIADIFDALTTDRPYRKGMDIQSALYCMQNYIGISYDERIYIAFCNAIAKINTPFQSSEK